MSFYIAMQNRRGVASYWHPQAIVSESDEFLIVSRSGENNEVLRIFSAGASSGTEAKAPIGLRPELFMIATLVSPGPNGGQIFLMERKSRDDLETGAQFVGGDGYLLLTESEGAIALRGSARIRSDHSSAAVFGHCVFFANDEPGATVHFDARYLPWIHEVLPGGFRSGAASGQDIQG